MNFSISQQIPATYARNNFKEVNEKALEEGMCVIVRKSVPITVLISMEEFQKMQRKINAKTPKKTSTSKKITLKKLRKNSIFDKYAGCIEKQFGEISSTELSKNWTKYVD